MSDGNKPAFPRTTWTGSERNNAHRDVPGMTLLEYYAGQALIGTAVAAAMDEDVWTRDGIAHECIKLAKALIVELNNHENP